MLSKPSSVWAMRISFWNQSCYWYETHMETQREIYREMCTLQHAPVGCFWYSIDMWWHLMTFFATIHLYDGLCVYGQILVGIYDYTEEAGVCLHTQIYREREIRRMKNSATFSPLLTLYWQQSLYPLIKQDNVGLCTVWNLFCNTNLYPSMNKHTGTHVVCNSIWRPYSARPSTCSVQ